MNPNDWRHAAACRGMDGDPWFPVGTTGPAELQAEEAKAVCNRCPVREQCLQWALDTRVEYGVWGGLDENERCSLRRNSRQPKRPYTQPAECGSRGGYKRHQREHTPICDPCRTANAAYGAELYHRNKQQAAS